ncbi:MAG: hypothetical protein M5U12_24300 [Verrucomicrobia bacterium]|nr:hypothetical protein [Verrucomicrobiota bacterium]
MTNPERILSALDRHLDHEIPLVIYGRAAVALGFGDPPVDVTRSLDVDAIIPLPSHHDSRAMTILGKRKPQPIGTWKPRASTSPTCFWLTRSSSGTTGERPLVPVTQRHEASSAIAIRIGSGNPEPHRGGREAFGVRAVDRRFS